MKTSFSRTFYPAVVILLAALLSIGLVYQIMARRALTEQAMERLDHCANTVATLTRVYHTEQVAGENAFLINLVSLAQVSQADIQLCDASGQLRLCSASPLGCEHEGLQLGQSFAQRVFSQGYVRDTALMQGLFDEVRHVVALPILDENGEALGIVLVSSPIDSALAALSALSRFFVYITLAVLVTSVIIMSVVARRHSDPLRQMSRVATAFGHGDYTARVTVAPTAPVEIRELALAFNNMAGQMEKSEYQRQEFIANVSHELKTPMTTIAGFADGILDGTIPPEKQPQYLRLISDETKRLSRLVRSMLDISRLPENGGIPEQQKTRFDVTECAGQVLLSFEGKITEKDLQVQVDMPQLPVYTRAHRDHIVQVIYNLLDNAVKFCPHQGQLGLQIRTGGNKIYVSVSNTGQTIPPEELPLVFDRFHKIDKSRTRNKDGWGLGLYIVRTLVCAHDEDISVESRDGRTEFTFTLPLIN